MSRQVCARGARARPATPALVVLAVAAYTSVLADKPDADAELWIWRNAVPPVPFVAVTAAIDPALAFTTNPAAGMADPPLVVVSQLPTMPLTRPFASVALTSSAPVLSVSSGPPCPVVRVVRVLL